MERRGSDAFARDQAEADIDTARQRFFAFLMPFERGHNFAGDPRAVLLDGEARERHYRGVMPLCPSGADELDVHRLLAEHKLERAGSVEEILGQLAPPELMWVLGDIELCRRLDAKPREGRGGDRSVEGNIVLA